MLKQAGIYINSMINDFLWFKSAGEIEWENKQGLIARTMAVNEGNERINKMMKEHAEFKKKHQ